jgi:hypothetical protein
VIDDFHFQKQTENSPVQKIQWKKQKVSFLNGGLERLITDQRK